MCQGHHLYETSRGIAGSSAHPFVRSLHATQLLLALCLDEVHLLLKDVVVIHASQALLLHVEIDGCQSCICNDLWRLATQHQLQDGWQCGGAGQSVRRTNLMSGLPAQGRMW